MIIFDFDMTLVDTSSVEHLRAARKWKDVMAQAPNLPIYDGITELLYELKDNGHTLAIVTKSPDMVPKRFIKEHGWPIADEHVIGFHQVSRVKPDPDGLNIAMRKTGATPETTIHVGDQAEDTAAAHAAGVTAVGSGWGARDVPALKASKPDHLCMTVAELRNLLLS